MCFLGSNRDPTQNSSKTLPVEVVAQKANQIAEVRLLADWKWGLKPYSHDNQISEVSSLGLALHLLSLGVLDVQITVCPASHSLSYRLE
jgi:hypothetical protein